VAASPELKLTHPIRCSRLKCGHETAPTTRRKESLNRAAAIAEHRGAEEAIEIVDGLQLDNYQYLHSTRAELLRRLGRLQEARQGYERVLALAGSEAERRFLSQRLAEL
jgi:RNA polymerase sigma-70 factor (ECF subfamily)